LAGAAEYHGFSDARNGEVAFLLPEARAFFTDASAKSGTLKLTLAGSDIGHRELRVKGAYWIGGCIRHFETKVRGHVVELEVPDYVDRLEYLLLDSEDQIFDFQRQGSSDRSTPNQHSESSRPAISPEYVAGPEDSGGFAELFPSAEFNTSPFDTTPFNSPPLTPRTERAVAGDGDRSNVWTDQSKHILAHLEGVEGVLQSVSAVLAQIKDVATNLPEPTSGIGHNHPPPEASLKSTT